MGSLHNEAESHHSSEGTSKKLASNECLADSSNVLDSEDDDDESDESKYNDYRLGVVSLLCTAVQGRCYKPLEMEKVNLKCCVLTTKAGMSK